MTLKTRITGGKEAISGALESAKHSAYRATGPHIVAGVLEDRKGRLTNAVKKDQETFVRRTNHILDSVPMFMKHNVSDELAESNPELHAQLAKTNASLGRLTAVLDSILTDTNLKHGEAPNEWLVEGITATLKDKGQELSLLIDQGDRRGAMNLILGFEDNILKALAGTHAELRPIYNTARDVDSLISKRSHVGHIPSIRSLNMAREERRLEDAADRIIGDSASIKEHLWQLKEYEAFLDMVGKVRGAMKAGDYRSAAEIAATYHESYRYLVTPESRAPTSAPTREAEAIEGREDVMVLGIANLSTEIRGDIEGMLKYKKEGGTRPAVSPKDVAEKQIALSQMGHSLIHALEAEMESAPTDERAAFLQNFIDWTREELTRANMISREGAKELGLSTVSVDASKLMGSDAKLIGLISEFLRAESAREESIRDSIAREYMKLLGVGGDMAKHMAITDLDRKEIIDRMIGRLAEIKGNLRDRMVFDDSTALLIRPEGLAEDTSHTAEIYTDGWPYSPS